MKKDTNIYHMAELRGALTQLNRSFFTPHRSIYSDQGAAFTFTR